MLLIERSNNYLIIRVLEELENYVALHGGVKCNRCGIDGIKDEKWYEEVKPAVTAKSEAGMNTK